MKILYHHRTQGQGAEGVHIRGMVEAFKALGCYVDLISPPGVDPYRKQNFESGTKGERKQPPGLWAFLANNCPQIIFELLEIFYNLYTLVRVSAFLRQSHYDIIYERYSLFGFVCSRLAGKYGIPLILEVNDATVIKRSRPLVLKRISRFIERITLENCHKIVTISQHFKRLLSDSHGISSEKIVVMSNAIDPLRFQLNSKNLITREKLGIKNKHIIGFVGAFVHWHGLDFLVRAMHDLVRKYDIHILLVGDGPAREGIENLINKFEISEYVTVTGFVDSNDVPYYIRLMDICTMPNSNEHGSPMKILEYMAMAKPVIAPAYEPIEEIITEGEEGLLFPPLDSEAFRSRVILLVKNEQIRRKIGENAKRKVFDRFTWLENARRTLALLGD